MTTCEHCGVSCTLNDLIVSRNESGHTKIDNEQKETINNGLCLYRFCKDCVRNEHHLIFTHKENLDRKYKKRLINGEIRRMESWK